MKNIKNRLFAAAIIAGLAVIGSVMNSRQSTIQGAGGPTVTIDQAQLPLPVQGSLSVGGTIAATQNGPWNVGIIGTPNVQVVNPATAPQFFLNLNDPGRIPFQRNLSFNAITRGFGDNAGSPVPNGHRMVIQHISVSASVSSSVTAAGLSLGLLTSRSPLEVVPLTSFPLNVVAEDFGVLAIADQPVLVYFDPGQQPWFEIKAGVVGGGINGSIAITLSGYMLDCSIAPCAAIAQ